MSQQLIYWSSQATGFVLGTIPASNGHVLLGGVPLGDETKHSDAVTAILNKATSLPATKEFISEGLTDAGYVQINTAPVEFTIPSTTPVDPTSLAAAPRGTLEQLAAELGIANIPSLANLALADAVEKALLSEASPASTVAGDSVVGGFNILGLLGGTDNIVSTVLVYMYSQYRAQIQSGVHRFLNAPKAVVDGIVAKLGIKDSAAITSIETALGTFADAGSAVLLSIADAVAAKPNVLGEAESPHVETPTEA